MHHAALQQAPAPTAGPSQALLNYRLGVRDDLPATCGWITDAPDPDNGALTSTVPVPCEDGQICAVQSDLNVRQCLSGTAGLNFYTACLDRASTTTSLGANVVSCGSSDAPFCNKVIYNDGYSGFLCVSTSADATRQAVAESALPPNAAQTTATSSGADDTNESAKTTAIAVGVSVPLLVIAIAAIAIWFCKCRRPRHTKEAPVENNDTALVVEQLSRSARDHNLPPPMRQGSTRWLKPQMYDWESSRQSTSTLDSDWEPRRPAAQQTRMPTPLSEAYHAERGRWARKDQASTSAGTPNFAGPPRF